MEVECGGEKTEKKEKDGRKTTSDENMCIYIHSYIYIHACLRGSNFSYICDMVKQRVSE
jgi:hypothetical protein